MLSTILSLPPREIPRAFDRVSRNITSADAALVAQALARRLSPEARAEAGDEAFAALLALEAKGQFSLPLYALHAALREAVIADAAGPLGLVPCDPRLDPTPTDLRGAAPHAAELLAQHGARGLAPIRMAAPIACSIEPLAWGDDPFSSELEDAELQAADLSGALQAQTGHAYSARPAPDGWSERSLRIPGATRLFIIAPEELFREASRRRTQKERAV